MNEKIRELAEQAVFDEIGKDYSLYFNLTKEKVEKFAELIIKECIYQVELTWMNQNGWSRNDDCVQSIKQKFGIK